LDVPAVMDYLHSGSRVQGRPQPACPVGSNGCSYNRAGEAFLERAVNASRPQTDSF
jgi:hypothetical protein